MPNETKTVVRSTVTVAGREYDRSSAIAAASKLINEGRSVPKDLAVFLREEPKSKKALTLARAGRKQHLINHGFTLITEAQSRGFKVFGLTAPKTAKNGDESFSVRLVKPGKDGKVSVVDIKTKLSAMSAADRKSILAELAQLQKDAESMPDAEVIDVSTVGAIAPAASTTETPQEPAH